MLMLLDILILVVSVAILRFHSKGANQDRLFLCAITIPLIFYIVNYPVRSIILRLGLVEVDYVIDGYSLAFALLYSLVFYGIMYYVYYLNTQATRLPIETGVVRSQGDVFLCNTTFVIAIFVFLYRYRNGMLFALYSEETDLYNTFGANFIGMLDPLKWFTIALAIILWKKTLSFVHLLQGITLFTVILFEALVSTAKGPIVGLFILYLFVKSVYKEKIHWLVIMSSVAAIIVLAVFSYYVRYYGTVTGDFSLDAFVNNIKTISEVSDAEYGIKSGLEGVANRLNYVDALVITQEKRGTIDTGIYWLGSIVEFLNMLPRFIWEQRPLINFNIFTTRQIWGYADFVSETPIGRIGESFLVLGYFGVLYAFFYGYIFAFIETRLVNGMCAAKLAYYFFLLNFYVIPDSHIVFYWKTIVFISLTLWILLMCNKHFTKVLPKEC